MLLSHAVDTFKDTSLAAWSIRYELKVNSDRAVIRCLQIFQLYAAVQWCCLFSVFCMHADQTELRQNAFIRLRRTKVVEGVMSPQNPVFLAILVVCSDGIFYAEKLSGPRV